MKFLGFGLVLLGFFAFSSCSKSKTLWVSGYKTEASAGAGKMQVLNVYKGKDLSAVKWENFYAPIEGFQFEGGVIQKIKVKETKLKNIPADASSLKYELVEVLEKQADYRVGLDGSWVLAKINGGPINRMVALPTLDIDVAKNAVNGNGGCNGFAGQIQKLTPTVFELGEIAGTLKMCINKNIEPEFYEALRAVKKYELKNDDLVLLDSENKEILSFIKAPNPMERLHDIWVAEAINGVSIDKSKETARMELNLKEKTVLGSNSCNNYNGRIAEIDKSKIKFSPLASTRKMCADMSIADAFDKAMSNTIRYKLEGLHLRFYDADGNELIRFLKVD